MKMKRLLASVLALLLMVSLLPMADHEFKVNEHLMVIGKKVDIDKILKSL